MPVFYCKRRVQRHTDCFYYLRIEKTCFHEPNYQERGRQTIGAFEKEIGNFMKTTGFDILEKDLFYPEEYFQKLLINERKRTERFGRPFMLILLDVGCLFKDSQKERGVVLQNLTFALNSSTREIDSKGWYMMDRLIGIICPEIYKATNTWVVDKIRQKLISFLDIKEAVAIKLYCIMYPDVEDEHYAVPAPKTIKEPHQVLGGVFHS
jgi:hypothetical protein